MRFPISSLSVLVAGLLVACGGKVPPEEFTAETGGSDAGADVLPSDSAVDTSAPTDAITKPDSPPPTAETCKKFVATLCSSKTAACCGKAGMMWNPDGCNTSLDYYCNTLVDQVTLGRATFDGSYLDACLKGWDTDLGTCEIDGLASAKSQIPCTHLFNGTKKVGEVCTGKTNVECEAPPGFGAYCEIRTGETMGKCRAYGFVGKDQPCNFYGSTVRYCDTGLYCDLTSSTTTCKTAKALGAACDGPDDFSCGNGAGCRMNKCALLGAAGATCARNEDCASYVCDTGKCTKAANPVVSSFMCTGGV
jgi:hypothetical protein